MELYDFEVLRGEEIIAAERSVPRPARHPGKLLWVDAGRRVIGREHARHPAGPVRCLGEHSTARRRCRWTGRAADARV